MRRGVSGNSHARSAYWRGARDCAPFIIIVVPYSMLFGVVARDAGLDLLQAMAMSIIVIAGASQFTAVALMQEHAPVFIVLLAALAVNARMAMYSAALQPHVGRAPVRLRAIMAYLMVDQAFALSIKEYDDHPDMRLREKLAYYFGVITPACGAWYGFTFLGAVLGRAVPPELSLHFAVPVCFIALVAPMMKNLPHVVAAFVSILTAVVFADLPYNLALVLAALLAMIAGARCEVWLARRRVMA